MADLPSIMTIKEAFTLGWSGARCECPTESTKKAYRAGRVAFIDAKTCDRAPDNLQDAFTFFEKSPSTYAQQPSHL